MTINILKDFDLKLLSYDVLSVVTEYFLNVSRLKRKQREHMLSWNEFCLEMFQAGGSNANFNEHIVELFEDFLRNLSLVNSNFNYFQERVFEYSIINDIFVDLFTDPVFNHECFQKLETFEELLIYYEVLKIVANSLFDEIDKNVFNDMNSDQ